MQCITGNYLAIQTIRGVMLDIDEVAILSKSLYTILKIEDLFTKTAFREKHLMQLNRIGRQFNIISRKRDITNNYLEDYIEWNSKRTSSPPMTKEECLTETTTLLCSFGLTHYELLKRFFIEALDIDKLDIKQKNKFAVTYGTIAKSFENLPCFDIKMREMLDTDLRNALAHDTWYFNNDNLVYENLGKELVEIPFAEIPQKTSIIVAVYATITQNYWEEFEQDTMKDYNEIGSQKVNEIFPLYENG